MHRNTFFILTVATMVLASTAEAGPQTGSGGSGGSRAVTTRAAARDSIRRNHQKLLLRIDSLRWEIDNRQLSEVERDHTARELSHTLLALQAALDDTRTTVAVAAAPVSEVEVMIPTMAFGIGTAARRGGTRGYLGVTFDGPSAEDKGPAEHVIRFFQYPRIAMVEPGSPAERARILEGDTLLSLNGTDVIRNEISLTKLLVPNRRIVMRVRREGSPRDVNVTVGETPDYYVRRTLPPRTGPPAIAMPPGAVAQRVGVYGQPQAPPAPEMPTAATAPVATGYMWVYNEGVAGARVEAINEGLGKAIGVSQGVLVLRVSPATPAHRSGLRDGDVILSADGKQLVRVNDLRSIVASGDGEEGVKLVILRERKQRDLRLRW